MSAVRGRPYVRTVSDNVVGGSAREVSAMDPNAPVSLVTASYSTRDGAVEDFRRVWGTRYDGEFHHTSIAVLTKGSDGELRVERTNSTAKHLVWGGALLGGATFVLAPTAGIGMLATFGTTGAPAIISHVREHADVEQLAGIAHLLEEDAWSLVVVAVNRRGEVTTPLLTHADRTASVDLPWGDLEEELGQEFARPVSGLVLVGT
jgi:hypothetical protein